MAADPSAPCADAPSSRLRPHTRRQPWILTYHSVTDTDDDPYGITVSPAGSPNSWRGCGAGGCAGWGWRS